MTIQINFKEFFQKQWRNVIYGVVGFVSLVFAICLMVWASIGSGDTVFITATATTTDSTRLEYLVGETVDVSTVTMTLPNGDELGSDEYTVTADFSSAGTKVVKLSYQDGNTLYEAGYGVEVFSVRHLDIRDKTIEKDRQGNWDFSDLVIWAELSGPSHEFEKPTQFSGIDDTAIILDERLFSVTITDSEYKDFYNATIVCGNLTTGFSFTPNPDALVQDVNRILSFVNESGTGEKLTLYVTNSSSNFAPPNGSTNIEVEGVYVLENAMGVEIGRYTFKYAINGWASTFKSAEKGQGLVDSMEDPSGDMLVTVNGITFRTGAWRKPILNM